MSGYRISEETRLQIEEALGGAPIPAELSLEEIADLSMRLADHPALAQKLFEETMHAQEGGAEAQARLAAAKAGKKAVSAITKTDEKGRPRLNRSLITNLAWFLFIALFLGYGTYSVVMPALSSKPAGNAPQVAASGPAPQQGAQEPGAPMGGNVAGASGNGAEQPSNDVASVAADTLAEAGPIEPSVPLPDVEEPNPSNPTGVSAGYGQGGQAEVNPVNPGAGITTLVKVGSGGVVTQASVGGGVSLSSRGGGFMTASTSGGGGSIEVAPHGGGGGVAGSTLARGARYSDQAVDTAQADSGNANSNTLVMASSPSSGAPQSFKASIEVPAPQLPEQIKPEPPSIEKELDLSLGDIIEAKLDTGVVLSDRITEMPVLAKDHKGRLWIGKIGLVDRGQASVVFDQVSNKLGVYPVKAIGMSTKRVPIVPMRARDVAINLAADVFRAALGGVANYVQGLESQKKIYYDSNGNRVEEPANQVGLDLQITKRVATMFDVPNESSTLERIYELPAGTKLLILVQGVGTTSD